ncbi:ATP-grasp domain-containing protein [Saccharothrix texasensis]|uniref:ATP-grasp domain-containing protein n=1 Tax=Saccharothrix texasensis TaxID=103734 RepID=A0A3N1HGY7_9PSEU|nr:ATP-grasp domain-containing protein [Saccharothrix texasensis]ROP41736.1 ATP-grasp domain-containing protein [Saccharothrix texasensis]
MDDHGRVDGPVRVTPHGVAAGPGSAALAAAVDEVVWYDRSAFITAACGPAIPGLTYRPRPRHATGPAVGHDGRPGAGRRVSVTFAPEDDGAARPWEHDPAARLLAPPRPVAEWAADKINAVSVFRAAGARTPPSVVLPAGATTVPGEVSGWLRDGPVVLQRRANNLIGRGTRLVRAEEELAEAAASWSGEPLKVSRHVPGLPITVSGCVGRDVTVVSGVSHQLVGIAELGAGWGTHCGNQLLGDADVPAGSAARARSACHAVGERLRARGFLGAFGIDAVLDRDGRVWAIEINPRFQTVVSLVHAVEVGRGLLPLLGVHVLAGLAPLTPVLAAGDRDPSAPPFSQLVAHFADTGRARGVPETGCYRMVAPGDVRRVADRALSRLGPDEALVWAHAAEGDPVGPGDEAVLVQFGHRVAAVEHPPRLTSDARAWLDALRPTARPLAGRDR